eukprot:g22909.t1
MFTESQEKLESLIEAQAQQQQSQMDLRQDEDVLTKASQRVANKTLAYPYKACNCLSQELAEQQGLSRMGAGLEEDTTANYMVELAAAQDLESRLLATA